MLGETSALCWQQAVGGTHRIVVIDCLLLRHSPTLQNHFSVDILQPKGRNLLVRHTQQTPLLPCHIYVIYTEKLKGKK